MSRAARRAIDTRRASRQTASAFIGGRTASVWALSKGQATERIEIVPRLRVNNSFSLRDAVITGHGIARLPQLVAAAEVATGRLSQLLPDWTLATTPMHAIYPSNRYLSPKVRAFVDLAAAWFSASATSDIGASQDGRRALDG